MYSCHWRTQWCKVASLLVTEGQSVVQLQVFMSLKDTVMFYYISSCHWRKSGVKLQVFVSLKDRLVYSFKSSCHWRTHCSANMASCHWKTQSIAFICFRDTEGHSGVQIYVFVSLKDSVVCIYMPSFHGRTKWCMVTNLLVTEVHIVGADICLRVTEGQSGK